MSNKIKNTNSRNHINGRNSSNNRTNKRTTSRVDRKSSQPWDEEKATSEVKNNAGMYFTSKELADQVSNFSFSNYLGVEESAQALGVASPGVVLSISLNPCPGITDGDANSAINIAGRKAYTYLSANNAKTTSYAPQDVTTLILAVGEVLSAIEVAKRAMKFAYTYNYRNRAFPLGIIRSMGFNASYVTDGSLAQLRIALNTAINKFNQVPIIMDNVEYLRKCVEMYSDVYADSEGPMVQYYLMMPYSTWILDETSYDQGSILKTTHFTDAKGNATRLDRDMSKFIATINDMIDALLTSTTFNYIYADLLRLADSNSVKLYHVELLGENETIVPVYNPMKLLQIHNSRGNGAPDEGTYVAGKCTPSNDVYPSVNKNALVYLPRQIGTLADSRPNTAVIDFPHSMGNPDVDQRIDATRYIGITTHDEEGYVIPSASTLPDHYICNYSLFVPSKADPFGVKVLGYISKNVYDYTDLAGAIKFTSALGNFDYAPSIYVQTKSGEVGYRFGDLDFYTVVDIKYLYQVNELANMGIFEFRV